MSTTGKTSEKVDEIASRARNRRDVPQLVDALRDALAAIERLGSPTNRTTPKQRSKMVEETLGRIARTLGAR
jgi:hypothetical protein